MWTGPQGRGEVAANIRELGRAKTPPGPSQTWPRSLRTAADLLATRGFEMVARLLASRILVAELHLRVRAIGRVAALSGLHREQYRVPR